MGPASYRPTYPVQDTKSVRRWVRPAVRWPHTHHCHCKAMSGRGVFMVRSRRPAARRVAFHGHWCGQSVQVWRLRVRSRAGVLNRQRRSFLGWARSDSVPAKRSTWNHRQRVCAQPTIAVQTRLRAVSWSGKRSRPVSLSCLMFSSTWACSRCSRSPSCHVGGCWSNQPERVRAEEVRSCLL